MINYFRKRREFENYSKLEKQFLEEGLVINAINLVTRYEVAKNFVDGLIQQVQDEKSTYSEEIKRESENFVKSHVYKNLKKFGSYKKRRIWNKILYED